MASKKPTQSVRRQKDSELAYDLLGISADAAQIGRALLRGERRRAIKNLEAIKTKFSSVSKKL